MQGTAKTRVDRGGEEEAQNAQEERVSGFKGY